MMRGFLTLHVLFAIFPLIGFAMAAWAVWSDERAERDSVRRMASMSELANQAEAEACRRAWDYVRAHRSGRA